ncbi:cyclic phosphodiesterase-like protein [Cystoisospora suis]|uniref:Cyclic phosphodiesterase-like protein n=1 Tax=Cystoisospora suis TaxID=483139 RepID=A0A2C6KR93_9APIC|nr:cyclic phosphodiesterase-like protein [Cystoisospora suis]
MEGPVDKSSTSNPSKEEVEQACSPHGNPHDLPPPPPSSSPPSHPPYSLWVTVRSGFRQSLPETPLACSSSSSSVSPSYPFFPVEIVSLLSGCLDTPKFVPHLTLLGGGLLHLSLDQAKQIVQDVLKKKKKKEEEKKDSSSTPVDKGTVTEKEAPLTQPSGEEECGDLCKEGEQRKKERKCEKHSEKCRGDSCDGILSCSSSPPPSLSFYQPFLLSVQDVVAGQDKLPYQCIYARIRVPPSTSSHDLNQESSSSSSLLSYSFSSEEEKSRFDTCLKTHLRHPLSSSSSFSNDEKEEEEKREAGGDSVPREDRNLFMSKESFEREYESDKDVGEEEEEEESKIAKASLRKEEEEKEKGEESIKKKNKKKNRWRSEVKERPDILLDLWRSLKIALYDNFNVEYKGDNIHFMPHVSLVYGREEDLSSSSRRSIARLLDRHISRPVSSCTEKSMKEELQREREDANKHIDVSKICGVIEEGEEEGEEEEEEDERVKKVRDMINEKKNELSPIRESLVLVQSIEIVETDLSDVSLAPTWKILETIPLQDQVDENEKKLSDEGLEPFYYD